MNQISLHDNRSLFPERATIKCYLLGWINQEIIIHKERQNLVVEQASTPIKIPLTISVAQLACLIKLFASLGLFNLNADELIHRISQTFSTKNSMAISSKSLRSKYYNIDTNAKSFIKDLIIRALNDIRKS